MSHPLLKPGKSLELPWQIEWWQGDPGWLPRQDWKSQCRLCQCLLGHSLWGLLLPCKTSSHPVSTTWKDHEDIPAQECGARGTPASPAPSCLSLPSIDVSCEWWAFVTVSVLATVQLETHITKPEWELPTQALSTPRFVSKLSVSIVSSHCLRRCCLCGSR